MPMHVTASGVYKITNTVNGKMYVGSTNKLLRRMLGHARRLNKNVSRSKHLQRAWNKYGSEVFEFRVLLVCDPTMLLFYEQRAIDKYKAYDGNFGYNSSPTVNGTLGYKFSEEQKQRLSLAHIGYVQSEETKAKRAESNRGQRRSLETRLRMSEAQKGHAVSKEQRKAISASLNGNVPSVETVEKREATRNNVFRKPERKYISLLQQNMYDSVQNWLKAKRAIKQNN